VLVLFLPLRAFRPTSESGNFEALDDFDPNNPGMVHLYSFRVCNEIVHSDPTKCPDEVRRLAST